jgi:alanyl-tRNA synthetase
MGDTGPCGPCSEIFYDHGEGYLGRPARFARMRTATVSSRSGTSSSCSSSSSTTDERVDLPRPSIDTGMGLERIAALLQGKHDNYDIDLFRRLIEASEEAHRRSCGGQAQGEPPGDRRPPALCLVPDCRRRAAVERGARLRAAPDHAPRHAPCAAARACKDPLMHRLVPTLVAEMGQAYPELAARRR